MKPFSRFGCLSTPALLLWFGGAAAEEVPATDASSLEEIVVTAQKRAERLQDVPIQVNVFSEQAIADAGIRSTQDFVSYVPNMTFDRADTYRNSFVVIRGLTQITNADSPLAVVVDGVPQNDQKQFNMRLFDIDRIEVLKGPQGTLYGRDAIGGAVNIVTRAPTRELSGFGEVSYGNGSATQATGGLSGPLGSDKVLFRLSADIGHGAAANTAVVIVDNDRIQNVTASGKIPAGSDARGEREICAAGDARNRPAAAQGPRRQNRVRHHRSRRRRDRRSHQGRHLGRVRLYRRRPPAL